MEFIDPSISSLDAAVRFGLELGHDLHAIEVVENEILENSGGHGTTSTTNAEDGKDFKLSHNYEDDCLNSKLVSEDEASLQTFVGLTLKDTFLSKLQPDSAPTVNLDNFMCNRQVKTHICPYRQRTILLLNCLLFLSVPKLQSTAMELHSRIEFLELQLETKEQELVASKNDLACLQRNHVELVASNDKLLQLYEKNKSKR